MEANHFSKAQHLEWCKSTALTLLADGKPPLMALTNLLASLRSHPETRQHTAVGVAHQLLSQGKLKSAESVKVFVERFLT